MGSGAAAGAHADVVVVVPWSRDGAVDADTRGVGRAALVAHSEGTGCPEVVAEGTEIDPVLVVIAEHEEVASRAPGPGAEDRVVASIIPATIPVDDTAPRCMSRGSARAVEQAAVEVVSSDASATGARSAELDGRLADSPALRASLAEDDCACCKYIHR